MSDHFVELPAPLMSEATFDRRRAHLLAELERPVVRRLSPVSFVVAAAVVLGVLAFAPISGASLAHRLVTGMGDLWSSSVPPTKSPAEVHSFTDDWNTGPSGSLNLSGSPLTGKARDLATGLGSADDTITAFPTTNGAVCYMIQGAGSCTNLEKWPWNTIGFTVSIFSTRDGGTRVYGIATDKIASAVIQVAGTNYPMTLENDALYYHLPPNVHESDLQQVVATWKDGSLHPFPFHSHWSPPRG